MANLLGVPQFDDSLARENMRFQAAAIQNLGAQVRSDLNTVLTNRQLQGFASGLQSVDPDSKDFPQQTIGLMMQYPLAAKSPIGTAAIQQLGAQHKLWAEERSRTLNPYVAVGGGYGVLDKRTGQIVATPEGTLPSKPVQKITDGYGNPLAVLDPNNGNQPIALNLDDIPLKGPQNAIDLENLKQGNRKELQSLKGAGASQQEKAIGQALNQALEDYSKTKSEVDRLQSLWEQIPEDDGNMFDPKTTNRNLKYTTGIKANGLRQKASSLEQTIKQLSAQLKGLHPDPVIPGLTPTDVAPVAPVNQDITAPAGELMVPVPENNTRKRRFNPATGTLE